MSLLIAFGPGAGVRMGAMKPHLHGPEMQIGEVVHEDFAARVSMTEGRDQGISQVDGVTLVLFGYVVGFQEQGETLRARLIYRFLERGAAFVDDLVGCFAIALHYKNESWLFSDRLGLLPLFMAEDGDGPLWASQAAPLLALLPKRTPDLASLWQFLAAGRFFAGTSPFRELSQADPGTRYHFDGRLSRAPWYSYRIEPQDGDEQALIQTLKELLDRAVTRHFHATQQRTLMLSGGYDSRYLLNTIAALFGPSPELLTWLWCEQHRHPDSDLAWAEREAARLKVRFESYPVVADPAWFDEMFDAQSGMTEQIFTHTDERRYARDLYERGYRCMFRGDELFGPDGGPLTHKAEALARVGLVELDQLVGSLAWLDDPGQIGRKSHRERLEALAALAEEPNDLRDLLYCRERLPALQAHLNAQRRPYLETHNPLLDPEVLEFNRRLTTSWRTDKRLFRACFLRHFPTTGFAKVGNGFDWNRLHDVEHPLSRFLREQLAELPLPLNRRFFQSQYLELTKATATGGMTNTQPSSWKLLTRAVILGHWLRRWPV